MNKKLATGILFFALGLFAVLSDAANFLPMLPDAASKLIAVIGTVIGFMGLREAMLQSQENIIKKVVDFTSQTFAGALILGILTFLLDGDVPGIPPILDSALVFIGAILAAFGLRDAGKRGVFAK